MLSIIMYPIFIPEFFIRICGMCQACKVIRSLVDRACITGMTGYEGGGGSINIQGEEQKKLDVITNDVLSKNLRFTGQARHPRTCKVANISPQ